MKRTPWFLTALNTLLLGLTAFANYVKAQPEGTTWPPSVEWLATWVSGRAAGAILVATLGVVVLQVLKESITVYQYRKDRVQRVLGKVVKYLLANDAKDNRCTLFQAVRGWRVMIQLGWRAVWYQDDKLIIFRDLARVKVLGYYLIVYARPTGSANDRSCVFFRVYRTKPEAAEGVAGRVWELGAHAVRDLPPVSVAKLKAVRELDQYPVNDPLRRFAEETNVRSATQLRARTRCGRHYYGTVIENNDGRKWGVLLVDSMKAECPFPQSRKKGDAGWQFSDRFRGYADTLSTMLT